MKDCLFCGMVAGDVPMHQVWEDEKHLAFLTIFPNTEGVTVVIPKAHQGSYVFAASDDVITELMLATKKVAHLLDATLADVGRTALVFEGFAIDHLHAKLYPMHGTKMSDWKPIESSVKKYFEHYEGYISSHDFERAPDEKLKQLAEKIRSTTSS